MQKLFLSKPLNYLYLHQSSKTNILDVRAPKPPNWQKLGSIWDQLWPLGPKILVLPNFLKYKSCSFQNPSTFLYLHQSSKTNILDGRAPKPPNWQSLGPIWDQLWPLGPKILVLPNFLKYKSCSSQAPSTFLYLHQRSKTNILDVRAQKPPNWSSAGTIWDQFWSLGPKILVPPKLWKYKSCSPQAHWTFLYLHQSSKISILDVRAPNLPKWHKWRPSWILALAAT